MPRCSWLIVFAQKLVIKKLKGLLILSEIFPKSWRVYVKKNMAVSEVGVACHMNIKRVGHKILGSLTVSQRKTNCDFDCSINPAAAALVAPRGVIFGSSCAGREGSSRTRPATAEVINGKTAVTPNTNLPDYHIIHIRFETRVMTIKTILLSFQQGSTSCCIKRWR